MSLLRPGVIKQHKPNQTKYADAVKSDKKYFWQDAAKKKMESLHSNEVWELVSPPENRKVIESIWIGQSGYASRVLERFGMTGCKPVSAPVDVRLKLQKESDSP